MLHPAEVQGALEGSNVQSVVEMTRMTSEMVPRWVKTLHRKRPMPGML